MAEIIPAIIPKSFQDLEEKMKSVSGLCDFIHIDITDGKFGGVQSWPYVGDKGEFKSILKQERGMPFWDEFDYEIHLMIENPISALREWIEAGATRIILHCEALDYDNDIQLLDQIKTEGLVQIGIAINAETPNDDLKPYFQVADFIQVMTIPSVGLQGASFDPRGIDKVQWIKKNYREMVVSVDGAMRPETAEIALGADVDRIVTGSFIFASENPREALEEMREIASSF